MSWDRVVEKFHWLSEPYADEQLRSRIISAVQEINSRPISDHSARHLVVDHRWQRGRATGRRSKRLKPRRPPCSVPVVRWSVGPPITPKANSAAPYCPPIYSASEEPRGLPRHFHSCHGWAQK
jgi:hypothetical protein